MITYKVAVRRGDGGYAPIVNPYATGTVYYNGQEATAECMKGLSHQPPARECKCGIYSVMRAGLWDALEHGVWDDDVLIAVIPHGRCITDGRIIRSERVTVLGPVEVTSVLRGRAVREFTARNPKRMLAVLADVLRRYRGAIERERDGMLGIGLMIIEYLHQIRRLLGLPPIDRKREMRLLKRTAKEYGRAVREGNVDMAHSLFALLREARGVTYYERLRSLEQVVARIRYGRGKQKMITYKLVRSDGAVPNDGAWRSLYGATEYRQGQTVIAKCDAERHEAPQRGCSCGVYSITRAGIWDALAFAQGSDTIIAVIPHGRVFTDGRVVRSGRVTVIGPVDAASILPKAVRQLLDTDARWPWSKLQLLASRILSLRNSLKENDSQAPARVVDALNSVRAILRKPPIDRARRRRLIAPLARRYGESVRTGKMHDAFVTHAAIRHVWGLDLASERSGLERVVRRCKSALESGKRG